MALNEFKTYCTSGFSTAFTALGAISTLENQTLQSYVYDTVTLVLSVVTFSNVISTSTLVFSLRSPTVLSSGLAQAQAVTVRWQSSDLSSFPSAYAASLASLVAMPVGPTSSSSSLSLVTSSPPPITHGLSTGGKAGIGVGAVLGFVALGALLILLLLRRKKKLQHPTVPEMNGQPSGFKRFLGGKWRAEAEAKSEPVEIDSRGIKVIPGPPVELEAAR
jgi:hypothetical protein